MPRIPKRNAKGHALQGQLKGLLLMDLSLMDLSLTCECASCGISLRFGEVSERFFSLPTPAGVCFIGVYRWMRRVECN
jgi:hypothetical protein